MPMHRLLPSLAAAALLSLSGSLASAQAQSGTTPAPETAPAAPAETTTETAPQTQTEAPAQAPAETPAETTAETPATAETTAEAPAAQSQPQLQEMAVHGDWRIMCLNGEAPCLMGQTGEVNGQRAIEVSIRKIEPQQTQAGTVEAMIEIHVPLGVLLGEGVAITVDQGKPQRAAYFICLQDGCRVRQALPNALVSQFKKGAKATISVAALNQGQPAKVDVDMSLNGFTAAFNALQP